MSAPKEMPSTNRGTPKRKNSNREEPPNKKMKMMTPEGVAYEKSIAEAKKKKYQRTSAKRKVEHHKKMQEKAIDAAARSELLLPSSSGYMEPEGPMDKTYKVTQLDIKEAVDLQSRDKIFSLSLTEFGPYFMEYSRDGRFILLAGQKGHVSLFDWTKNKLLTEFNVKETVRDVAFLHNETMFALAQKNQVYVYDKKGVEIHSLRKHRDVYALQFLPYHFLLTTVGREGNLRYQDISTGEVVAVHSTKLGPCSHMKQNPHNAVLHLGHTNGCVTLWSPNMSTPLVKMLCHKGAVSDLAINRSGHYMVTTGLDCKVKVYDIRTFKKLKTYETPGRGNVASIDISQKGALALGTGSHVQIWKDYMGQERMKEPYLIHRLSHQDKISRIRFCPFEDVVGVGHHNGFSSILVPGVGEPNFDTFEANPYQTTKQRRETTVVKLLEKVPADMITLDPNTIGTISREPAEQQKKIERLMLEANNPGLQWTKTKKEKKKARGKNKAGKKVAKKEHVHTDKAKALQQVARQQEEEKEKKEKRKSTQAGTTSEGGDDTPPEVYSALERFNKKK